MNQITQILDRANRGDSAAADELLPLVYEELRKLAAARIAREAPGQTLQATALVHEAYLRLVGHAPSGRWDHRGHFFAASAEAMRRILVEQARRKASLKHGGEHQRVDVSLQPDPSCDAQDPVELLIVDELLDELAAKSPRKAELVKLRVYLGCTVAEAAEALDIAASTAEEDWTYARAWLRRRYLQDGEVAKSSE